MEEYEGDVGERSKVDLISFIFNGYYTADMSKMVVISSTFVTKVEGFSIVM